MSGYRKAFDWFFLVSHIFVHHDDKNQEESNLCSVDCNSCNSFDYIHATLLHHESSLTEESLSELEPHYILQIASATIAGITRRLNLLQRKKRRRIMLKRRRSATFQFREFTPILASLPLFLYHFAANSFSLVRTFNSLESVFVWDLNTLRVNLNEGGKPTKCLTFTMLSNTAANDSVSFLILFVETIILWSKQGDQWVNGDRITTKIIGFPSSNTNQLTLHWGN